MKDCMKECVNKTRIIVIIAGIIITTVLTAQAGWLGVAVGLAVTVVLCMCSAAIFIWMLRAVPFLMRATSLIAKKIRERLGNAE